MPWRRTQFILEAAALTHDIGIKNGEAKFGAGKCSGKTQELEGPPAAAELLAKLGFAPDVCERVCYLIGHHHTYTNIDGMDYQILVEADFLVNFYEDGMRLSRLPAGEFLKRRLVSDCAARCLEFE